MPEEWSRVFSRFDSMAATSDPTSIAREALRQLASHRVAPTPDNYRKLYDEIAGVPSATIAPIKSAQATTPAVTPTTQNEMPPAPAAAWGSLIGALLKQLEIKHSGLTATRKREGLNRVLARFAADPVQLHAKLQALIHSWSESAAEKHTGIEVAGILPQAASVSGESPHPLAEHSNKRSPDEIRGNFGHARQTPDSADQVAGQLRELLAQALESAVAGQLGEAHSLLATEARSLAQQARAAHSSPELARFATAFKKFCSKLELHGEEGVKLQQGLLRLFSLLVENIGELLADDQWLSGQLAVLRGIMSSPLDLEVIAQAERSLKEVIFKQGMLKHSLNEAKNTLKDMVTRFIDRLGELSEITGEYHNKIEHYSEKISHTEDIVELNQLLTEVMRETKSVQTSALRSRDDLMAAREEANAAQARIKQMELEIQQISEKVREDQLTGTLNRRGLDDAFEREASRADRKQSPLCLAMLDIDNFKRVNDTHGHQAGDNALVHLVNVVKETVRPSDVVGRFGGEEFMILLPDTGVEEAVSVLSRLQRNLTKQFFLHDNERLLITFSAGVAQRMPAESQAAIVARSDKALYRAKQAGKNRVFTAQ